MRLYYIFLGLTLSFALNAQPEPAHVFGSHMVLQRHQPIRIWGKASPGERIKVEFNGQKKRCRANLAGNWRLKLRQEPAGGPYTLSIAGKKTVVLEDILVGDVWVCSGQSNMEWILADAAHGPEEVAAADFPMIRHLDVPNRTALEPESDIAATPWRPCTPEYAGDFSAVGYFFARKVFQETGVPIGLLNASWGGTHCETWTSRKAVLKNSELKPSLAKMPVSKDAFEKYQQERLDRRADAFQGKENSDPDRWMQSDFPDNNWPILQLPKPWEDQGLPDFDGIVWFRKKVMITDSQATQAATLLLGMIDDCDTTFVNGIAVGNNCKWDDPRVYPLPAGVLHAGENSLSVKVTDWGGGGGFWGEGHLRLVVGADTIPLDGPWKAQIERRSMKTGLGPNSAATLLFNGMLHPLLRLGVRGAIWYQGESNVSRAEQYTRSFPAMIRDWRKQWKQKNLPFYFVQLAAYLPLEKNTLESSPWAELRDAQRQALALPHTGMAVATDIGDAHDIHPRNKQDVGLRLALHALKNEYGKNVECNGPEFESMRIKDSDVTLRFRHAGKRLIVKDAEIRLRGFTLAGADQKFYPATSAYVVDNEVHLFSKFVPKPVAVRYGWVDNPEECNLYNFEGLPASPFRTDNWKWATQGVVFFVDLLMR